MKLENEFSVDAPLDRTWETLLDIERVAGCLPGARLAPSATDGVHRGEMQLRLGPMTLTYKGTARLAEVDVDEHSATIEARARELNGSGTATAYIRNHLKPGENGSTRVRVETELGITGRPAQFGRGIVEDVAGRMLADFAERLEREILAREAPTAKGPTREAPARERSGGAAQPAPEEGSEADSLDLAGLLLGPVGKRSAIAVGALALLLVLGAALRQRPRR